MLFHCDRCKVLQHEIVKDIDSGGWYCMPCLMEKKGMQKTMVPAGGNEFNRPKHYTFGKIEVRNVILDWGLDWDRANAIKYIARAPHKGTAAADIRKAITYLTFYLEKLGDKEPEAEKSADN